MKHLCYFIFTIISLTQLSMCSISDLKLSGTGLSSSKIKIKEDMRIKNISNGLHNKIKPSNKKNNKFSKNAFIWEGWLRYIRIIDKPSTMEPSSFFVNPQFDYQRVFKTQLKKKDEIGYINIIDKFQFFGVLKTDGLFIYKSRKLALSKMVEQIKIVEIIEINENKKYLSSVREIGNFREGFCLRIKTKYPHIPNLDYNEDSDGHTQDYIICLDKKKQRDILVKYFVDLKIAQQRHNKIVQKRRPPKSLSDLFKKLEPTPNISRPKNWVPKDGYWILLQDWTTCSLKCGGGSSYQQWMCVPPKRGGRKCQGKAIRTRPCNTQPCPGTLNLINTYRKSGIPDKVLKPIFKSMPFSLRPQNYLKCQIKENDVFYLTENPNNIGGRKIKRPSRIIMNTHSISVFNDDNYKQAVFSFDLKKTLIAPKRNDNCCFDLLSGKLQYTICGGFGQSCGTSSNPKFVNEWVSHFNLFKVGCYENLKIRNWKSQQSKRAMKDALDSIGLDGLNDRANLIKKKLKIKQEDDWNKKLQKTQGAAMKMIRREFDIEKMLQQELQLKAELEAKELIDLKKRELLKKECLEKALKERDSQNKILLENKHKENELSSIKENAKKEVESQRSKLRMKLNDIRKKFKRRKRIIEQDINVIRAEMAKNLINAHKKGDMMVCKNAIGNKEKINSYCNKELVDNYVKNIECRTESNFCYVCCENEFGNLEMEKRDICYNMCDNLMKKSLNGGEFMWT